MSRKPLQHGEDTRLAVASSRSAKKDGNDAASDDLFFESSRWLTAKQAAAYLGLASAEVLRNWVHQGRVNFYKLGRSLRFRISDLDRLPRPAFPEGRFRV